MSHSPVKVWRHKGTIVKTIGVKGKIVSWTLIRVAAKPFTKAAPYPVVLVQLDDASRMIGELVDYHENELKFDQEVIAVLRRSPNEHPEDIISYVIKFKPTR